MRFGQPGPLLHLAFNISNGFASSNSWTGDSLQPSSNFSASQFNPVQQWNSLRIYGANNNINPFVEPYGNISTTVSNNSPADCSLNIQFDELSIYGLSVSYEFDISCSYKYPPDADNNNFSTNIPSNVWGEQYNPPSVGGTAGPIPETDISIQNVISNTWNHLIGSSSVDDEVGTFIFPGFIYTLRNYKMILNGNNSSNVNNSQQSNIFNNP